MIAENTMYDMCVNCFDSRGGREEKRACHEGERERERERERESARERARGREGDRERGRGARVSRAMEMEERT